MINSGELYRAELFDDHSTPYTNVQAVYEANKGRHHGKLIVTNAHWYKGTKPCGNYKVDGALLSQEWASALGIGWKNGAVPVMGWSDMSDVDNFLCTIPAIVGGVRQDVSNQTAGVKRLCERTWWGFNKDGKCTIEVTTTDYTLDGIIDRMESLGIVNGLVLDGSGSSQCYDGKTRQTGDGRTIYSYLLLWFEETEGTTKYKVCLDAGHGGNEVSNGSPDKTYYEHEFTLDMAKRVRDLISPYVDVVMTREDNVTVSLTQRATIANNADADVYVSLHSNASGSGWSEASGLTVWTYAEGGERDVLANKLLTRFKEIGIPTFGTELYHQKFTVLAKSNMPAVLVEYLFHSNKADAELLKSTYWRDEAATATAKGILDYLGIAYKAQDTAPTEAELAAAWVKAQNISDGTRPSDTATREEIWQMLYRAFNK